MELNHGWKMRDFDPGQAPADVAAPDFDDQDWTPALVPGDVHTALWAAGKIPDPYYDRNVEQLQWVENREWWFRLEFEDTWPERPEMGPVAQGEARRFRREARLLAGLRESLTFDGLDLYATVYLNGEEIGSHANMFRPAEFDVTGLLEPEGRNVLAVRFDPVPASIQARSGGQQVPGQWGVFGVERVWARKTQSQFSWDWAPRCVNVGIWRPVRLERHRHARLRTPYVRTLSVTPEEAIVLVESEVEQWGAPINLTVEVRIAESYREGAKDAKRNSCKESSRSSRLVYW